jgi:ribose-phosphate pyrophosphokinase
LKIITKVINNLFYDKIFTCDPHSDVTTALVDNIFYESQTSIIKKYNYLISKLRNKIVLLSPDAGSLKKIYPIAFMLLETYNIQSSIICATKIRDEKTGKLSGFKIYDTIPENSQVLVVDDICDGGGTFIGLSEQIPKSCEKLLYITHGIFSKGIDVLTNHFNMVFTTNSFYNTFTHPNLNKLELEDFV